MPQRKGIIEEVKPAMAGLIALLAIIITILGMILNSK